MSNKTPYRIEDTFENNALYGPFFDGELPDFGKQKAQHNFLGHKVNSQFGLPSTPMTFTARGIGLYAKLGYDIITYRSVRSVEWLGLAAPNWLYVDVKTPLKREDLSQTLKASLSPFPDQDVSTANSFGIQSYKPEYWQQEYERAKSYLQPGQVLILALMITPEDGQRDAVQDAIEVAKYAVQTSADIFEINLACPNSGSKALIYEDVPLCVEICKEIKKVIGKKHLLAKVGYYSNSADSKKFLAETKGILSGISSTNTYSMKITNADGTDAFPGRPTAGVSGAAVRALSMEQLKYIVQLKKDLDLRDFVIIGIGGVTKPEHIREYLELGADAVQSAVGAWVDPYLAAKYKGKK